MTKLIYAHEDHRRRGDRKIVGLLVLGTAMIYSEGLESKAENTKGQTYGGWA